MSTRPHIDPALYEYATERQGELLRAWEQHGTAEKAAGAIGVSRQLFSKTLTRLKQKAAKQGYAPEYDYTRPVPDGYKLRGVSSYYGKDGELRGQWVKSQIDHERQAELLEAMVKGINDQLIRAPMVKAPVIDTPDKDLLVAYPVGDHHFGMLAWDKEAGEDYDLPIAETVLADATDYLMAAAPPAETGLIALLGDFFHYDNFEPVTPRSKNQLDADSRFPKMIRVGLRAVKYMIAAGLKKHKTVHVIVEIGNHDPSTAICLMEALHFHYGDDPRVTIDTSPKHFHYYRFGKTLIGTHHGDMVKMPQLPLIMAADRPGDWGDTTYRYWWTGHIHHSKVQAATGAQDYSGCSVESFRVLAAADAWAAHSGYRPIRDMKSIVIHQEFGEVSRNTVNPRMFEK